MSKTFFLRCSLFLGMLLLQKIAIAGCEQLQITVNNKTNYTFTADPSPSMSNGTVTSLPSIFPGDNNNPIILAGTQPKNSNYYDEINGTLQYYATANRGVHLMIPVAKSSCNISQVSCKRQCWTKTLGKKNYISCDSCTFKGGPISCRVECEVHDGCSESGIFSSTNTTQQSTSENLYTGASSNDNPYLHCDDSLCSEANHNCYISDGDSNKAAKTSFTVYPAILTQLIITLPFSNTSPLAKAMLNSIYNNLKATSLSALTTFNVIPVVLESSSEETTMTFSTLCNTANCPEAVTT
ncbi:MAG: hypothetical protein V4496_06550 [Pseudomonadota bacterium]